MSATATPTPTPVRAPRGPVVPPPRRSRLGWWAAAAGAVFLIVVAPVALFAGAGNPPGCSAAGDGSPGEINDTGGPAPGGHFAAPLNMNPGSWYRIGATEYGPPGTGTQGSAPGVQGDLAIHPNSFAELSTLDYNPANVSQSALHVRRRRRARDASLRHQRAGSRVKRPRAGAGQARHRVRPGAGRTDRRGHLPDGHLERRLPRARRVKEPGLDRAGARQRHRSHARADPGRGADGCPNDGDREHRRRPGRRLRRHAQAARAGRVRRRLRRRDRPGQSQRHADRGGRCRDRGDAAGRLSTPAARPAHCCTRRRSSYRWSSTPTDKQPTRSTGSSGPRRSPR